MLIKFSDRFYYTKQRYMYLEPTLGYVKGEYFSVMLDSGNGPAQVETFLKELKENDLPMPSYVILTHHHWDHSFGAAYLDIPVIATDRARDSLIELSQLEWDDESLYQRVKDGTEIKYSADVIKRVYENHEIKIRIPDLPKMADFNLNLGGVKINCIYNDNSHSNDAFLIYIAEEKVLFLGDSHAKNYYTKPMSYDKVKLRDYIDKNIEDDKGWNVISQIKDFGKNIFKDFYKDHKTELDNRFSDESFFNDFITDLRERRTRILNRLNEHAKQMYKKIRDANLDNPNLFNRGANGLLSHIIKLTKGTPSNDATPQYVQSCIDSAEK